MHTHFNDPLLESLLDALQGHTHGEVLTSLWKCQQIVDTFCSVDTEEERFITFEPLTEPRSSVL